MRKWWILLALVVLLAGGLYYAATNFNRYLRENRAWLAQQASSALGRPVEFQDVGVSFSGGLGARVEGLSIGDDPSFGKEPFLRVASANVVVKILPALRGEYQIRRVVLDEPRINVIRNATGFNFESIGKAATPRQGAAEKAPPTQEKSSGGLPLLVSLLSIEDGQVHFVDRTSSPPSQTDIDQLDVSVSDLSLADPIQLDVAAALLGEKKQNLHVAGTVGPLGSPDAAAQAPVDLTIKLGPVIIDRLKKVAVIGPSIPGPLSSPDPIDVAVSLSGKLDALRTSVTVDATDAALRYDGQLDKPAGTALRLDADVRRTTDAIEVQNLDLRFAQARLEGKGRIGSGAAMPVDFTISGAAVPLAGWGSVIPAAAAVQTSGTLDVNVRAQGNAGGGRVPALTGTIALKGVRASQPDGKLQVEGLDTVITLSGDRVEMPATEFKVNGEPVRMQATVKSLQDLSSEFSLTSPQLALAALGAGAKDAKQPEVVKDLDVRGTFRSAEDGPRLAVTLRSDAGTVRDVTYSNLRSEANLHGQTLTLNKVSLAAFGGNVAGAGSYKMQKTPEFSFRGKVGGMDVAALVDYLAPKGAVQMSGRLDADLDVRGSGAGWEPVKESLTGGGGVEVKQGVLKGVNVAEEVLRSVTGVQGLSGLISPSLRKKYPQLFSTTDTAFDSLATQMTLGGGEVTVQSLTLAAQDYAMNGRGSIDLDNALDLGMRFLASQNLTQDLLHSVKELKYLLNDQGRFQIPVVLRGSIPSIRPQPDVAYLSKQLTGALVESGVEKGLDALLGKKGGKKGDSAAQPAPAEKQTEKLIRKGLQGLFGGANKEKEGSE